MRIAYITSRFPFPTEKGDKLRAFQHIRYLSRAHEVHCFAITHDPVTAPAVKVLEAHCASVRIYRISRWKLILNIARSVFNGLPVQVGYFLDPAAKRLLQTDLIRTAPDHIVTQLIRTTEYVRSVPHRKTLDYMDTFSYGASQRASSDRWWKRAFYLFEAHRLRKYERQIYQDFDHHLIISHQDRARLPLPYQRSVHVLPNGVDLDHYQPQDTASASEVVFVGNMGYMPNIEAAEFLVQRVMPEVWQTVPEATVCIAGARPHRRVRRLQSPKVRVTGWVEDVRPLYASGRVFVAPMFSGMGQQNKILEAMAMGRPCITTSIVNNAIGATPNVHLLLAENSRQFADQIVHVITDPALAGALAGAARQFVEDEFDWESQNKKLDRILYKQEIAEHA
ncbi:MAG: glycosyltransferase [Saprospiraceae bacterium]|nr:glycosyltransferase [Saprospiraceae bacterium]